MALNTFQWGSNGEQLTPSQVKSRNQVAAALANRASAPKTFGEGLSRVGEALLANSYEAQASAGEADGAASRKTAMDAILANSDPSMADLAGAAGNPWVADDPGSQAVIQAMMAQEAQQQGWAHDAQTQQQGWDHDASVLKGTQQFALDNRDAGWAREDAQLADQRAQPTVINDQRVDPATGKVLGDYRSPPSSGVNIYTGDGAGSTGQDPTLNKYLSQKEGEAWSGYKDAGTVSASNAQDFGVLDELLTVAPQGPIQGRLADTFKGFSSAGDAVNSIVKRIAPTLRAVGSGSTSDIEYQGMLDSLPSLSGSPEGNQMILSIMKAKAQVNIQRADIVTKYQNGDMTVSEARKAMSDLNQTSIMTPEMRKALLGVGATDNVAPATPQVGEEREGYRFKGGNPADPASWEQVM